MNSSVTSLAAPVIPACRANTYNARSPSAKPHWGRSEREHTTSAAACNFVKRRCGERKGPSPLPRFAFPRSIHQTTTRPPPAPPRLGGLCFPLSLFTPAFPRTHASPFARRGGGRVRAPVRPGAPLPNPTRCFPRRGFGIPKATRPPGPPPRRGRDHRAGARGGGRDPPVSVARGRQRRVGKDPGPSSRQRAAGARSKRGTAAAACGRGSGLG